MKYQLLVVLFSPAIAIATEFPPATDFIADCENRWFLSASNDPTNRILGFAYVDASAGVTFELNGEVGVDERGALVRNPSSWNGKARVIVRVTSNQEIVCLSVNQVAQLGLPLVPDWLEIYKDDRDAGPHSVSWASHYNEIGASEKALEFIQAAIGFGYFSSDFYFEHGFALNALGRCKDAAHVLESAVYEYPESIEMLGELAYSYYCLRELKHSIELYEAALSKSKTRAFERRAEFAHNLSVAYSELGDDKASRKWRKKAEKWQSDR